MAHPPTAAQQLLSATLAGDSPHNSADPLMYHEVATVIYGAPAVWNGDLVYLTPVEAQRLTETGHTWLPAVGPECDLIWAFPTDGPEGALIRARVAAQRNGAFPDDDVIAFRVGTTNPPPYVLIHVSHTSASPSPTTRPAAGLPVTSTATTRPPSLTSPCSSARYAVPSASSSAPPRPTPDEPTVEPPPVSLSAPPAVLSPPPTATQHISVTLEYRESVVRLVLTRAGTIRGRALPRAHFNWRRNSRGIETYWNRSVAFRELPTPPTATGTNLTICDFMWPHPAHIINVAELLLAPPPERLPFVSTWFRTASASQSRGTQSPTATVSCSLNVTGSQSRSTTPGASPTPPNGPADSGATLQQLALSAVTPCSRPSTTCTRTPTSVVQRSNPAPPADTGGIATGGDDNAATAHPSPRVGFAWGCTLPCSSIIIISAPLALLPIRAQSSHFRTSWLLLPWLVSFAHAMDGDTQPLFASSQPAVETLAVAAAAVVVGTAVVTHMRKSKSPPLPADAAKGPLPAVPSRTAQPRATARPVVRAPIVAAPPHCEPSDSAQPDSLHGTAAGCTCAYDSDSCGFQQLCDTCLSFRGAPPTPPRPVSPPANPTAPLAAGAPASTAPPAAGWIVVVEPLPFPTALRATPVGSSTMQLRSSQQRQTWSPPPTAASPNGTSAAPRDLTHPPLAMIDDMEANVNSRHDAALQRNLLAMQQVLYSNGPMDLLLANVLPQLPGTIVWYNCTPGSKFDIARNYDPADNVLVYSDGAAAMSDDGGAGSGVVIYAPLRQGTSTREIIAIIVAPLVAGGGTNNYTEHFALYWGARVANSLGVKSVSFVLDSTLTVDQITQRADCNRPDLVGIRDRTLAELASFQHTAIAHVKRKFNTVADVASKEAARLSKNIINNKGRQTRPDGRFSQGRVFINYAAVVAANLSLPNLNQTVEWVNGWDSMAAIGGTARPTTYTPVVDTSQGKPRVNTLYQACPLAYNCPYPFQPGSDVAQLCKHAVDYHLGNNASHLIKNFAGVGCCGRPVTGGGNCCYSAATPPPRSTRPRIPSHNCAYAVNQSAINRLVWSRDNPPAPPRDLPTPTAAPALSTADPAPVSPPGNATSVFIADRSYAGYEAEVVRSLQLYNSVRMRNDPDAGRAITGCILRILSSSQHHPLFSPTQSPLTQADITSLMEEQLAPTDAPLGDEDPPMDEPLPPSSHAWIPTPSSTAPPGPVDLSWCGRSINDPTPSSASAPPSRVAGPSWCGRPNDGRRMRETSVRDRAMADAANGRFSAALLYFWMAGAPHSPP